MIGPDKGGGTGPSTVGKAKRARGKKGKRWRNCLKKQRGKSIDG